MSKKTYYYLLPYYPMFFSQIVNKYCSLLNPDILMKKNKQKKSREEAEKIIG
jgi:hypothetical protein